MNTIVSFISSITLAPLIRWLFIKEVRGKENIPDHNFIMASNHQSHIDLISNGQVLVPRVFRYIGQTDAYVGFERIIRDVVYFISGTIRMDRTSAESKAEAMERALQFLLKGESIIIFPEGTRSRTGEIARGKKGISDLLIKSETAILPTAISGAFELFPPGGKVRIKKNIRMNIGKPMYFKEEIKRAKTMQEGTQEYKDILQEIVDKIMEEIKRLKNEIL